MPSPSELESAKNMLNAYRGNRVLAVTITYDEWMRGTDGGILKVRSSELQAIDTALRDYHAQGKSEGAFVRLRQAFESWSRTQQLAGKAWTESVRNKSGVVSQLHEQLVLAEAGRSVKNMSNTKDWEARMALVEAERGALNALFQGRRLVFKTAVRSGVMHVVQQYTAGATGYRGVSNLVKGSSGAVSSQRVAEVFQKVGGAVPEHVAAAFGVTAEQICSAFANVINFGVAPVKLLNDLVNLGLGVKARVDASNARFAVAQGNAEAALEAVIRLINQEMMVAGKDLVQHAGSVVATAFGAGPIASAANAVVDVIVNNALYVRMGREMQRGNAMISAGHVGLNAFEASPVLGCYFLVLADTNAWVNYSVHDIGTDGWTKQIDMLVRRADPVREKARELILTSKYAVSGSEGFKGLEWEPSWRNNKLMFLKQWMRRVPAAGAIASYRVFG
jgi:hypothetical protein